MPDLSEPNAIPSGRVSIRKPRTPEGNPLVYGKLPPQARELEEAVLGAMLIDRDAVSEIIDILKPESFYLDSHQTIYRAIMTLFERSEPVDILTFFPLGF